MVQLFGNKKNSPRQTCRCPKCGCKCEAGFKFCPDCGYQLKKSEAMKAGGSEAEKESHDEFSALDSMGRKDFTMELEDEPDISGEEAVEIPDVRVTNAPRGTDKELKMLYR